MVAVAFSFGGGSASCCACKIWVAFISCFQIGTHCFTFWGNDVVKGKCGFSNVSLVFASRYTHHWQKEHTIVLKRDFILLDTLDWKGALYQVTEDMDSMLQGRFTPVVLMFDEIEAITFGVGKPTGPWYDGN